MAHSPSRTVVSAVLRRWGGGAKGPLSSLPKRASASAAFPRWGLVGASSCFALSCRLLPSVALARLSMLMPMLI
eukprot:scaffold93_cov112-Isochrysis_galbana.AAC.5